MLAKWKKVEEVPPIVDVIDSIGEIMHQPIKQIDGHVQIFLDFSSFGLEEMKTEIVQRSQTISEFVTQIVGKYINMLPKELGIFFDGVLLEGNRRFDDIKNNTVLKLFETKKFKGGVSIQTFVKSIYIDLKFDILVHQLKLMIQEKEGIHPDQQRLSFKGKPLMDYSFLSDYQITKDSTIFLFVRTSGGCFPGFAPIKTSPDTIKYIKDINIGEQILCYDFEKREFKISTVVYKKISSMKQQLIEIIHENGSIICTPNHPLYTQKGWKALQPSSTFQNEELSVQDLLFDSKCNFVKILEINYLKEEEIVYNITTEYPNNFIAYDILVHNMNRIIIIINDQEVKFEILPHYLVQNIKIMIEQKIGIPWKYQVLFYQGIEMVDSNSLLDYQIQFGSTDIPKLKLLLKNQVQQSQEQIKSENQTKEISIIAKNEQHKFQVKQGASLEEIKDLLYIYDFWDKLILYNGVPENHFDAEKQQDIESIYLIGNDQGGTQLKFHFEINNHQLQNLSQLKDSLQWLGNPDINEFIEYNLKEINNSQEKQSFYQQNNLHNLIAIRLYTTNLIYRRLNCDLRLSKCEGWIKYLKCMMDGLRQMEYYHGVAYRGIKNYQDSTTYQKGSTVQWSEMTSLSLSQKTASRFSNNKGMIFEIQLISAKNIQLVSQYYSEEEVIMYPFSNFLIKEIQDQQNQPTKVKMREIPLPRSQLIILWVDDNPENNFQYAQKIELENNNISIVFCTSTSEAIKIIEKYKWLIFLAKSQFRIVSDMVRVENGKMNYYAGIELIGYLYKTLQYKNQTLIFCGDVKKAQEECKKKQIQGNYFISNDVSILKNFIRFQ